MHHRSVKLINCRLFHVDAHCEMEAHDGTEGAGSENADVLVLRNVSASKRNRSPYLIDPPLNTFRMHILSVRLAGCRRGERSPLFLPVRSDINQKDDCWMDEC